MREKDRPVTSGSALWLAATGLNPVAWLTAILYNGGMAIDRKKLITGKELEELIDRDKEAVASLACEGIHCTSEEDAVFAEMNRLGLSYDDQGKYLDDWLNRTYGIPLPDPA